jgi:hypothetical protein
LLISVAAALQSFPAPAQDTGADQAVARAKRVYRVETGSKRCSKTPDDSGATTPDHNAEIVVCAPDHGEDQRIPPTSETDPESREALRDGLPHAPQFDRGYCAKCAHFGKVPPPVYYFDIKALPEAPKDSDADKIARGEMPAP